MKILIIHNSYQQKGGEDVVVEQEIALLKRHGHEVVVYRRSNTESSELTRWALASRIIWARDVQREVAELIRQERPTLVHVHNTFFMISPSVYSACQAADVPIVQTLHNYRLLCPAANLLRDGQPCDLCIRGTLLNSIVHACYRESRLSTASVALMLAAHRMHGTWTNQIDHYIALSQFSAETFIAGGLPADKLTVKPNAVYPDPGARNGTGEYALFVGRLSLEKGVDTLLQAWSQVDNSVPLVVIGEGPLSGMFGRRLKGDSRVVWKGQCSRSAVFTALKGARFLVFPSRCFENFPMTIAEAYACGVPVIASDMGAAHELVRHGDTGLLFRPGDATHLAESVQWAWNHPAELKQMGTNCRAEFELNYSPERNYELLMQIYDQALAKRGCDFISQAEDGALRRADSRPVVKA